MSESDVMDESAAPAPTAAPSSPPISEVPSLTAWLWTWFALITIGGMAWWAAASTTLTTKPLRWQDILPQDRTPLHQWEYVVIHHSGAEVGDAVGIDRDHQSRGWEGIGYHFIIGNGQPMPLGRVEWSFRWNLQRHGAHVGVGDMNKKAIGICMIGNFDLEPAPERQWQRAVELTALLLTHIPSLSLDRVVGHGEIDGTNTHCPGGHTDMNLFRAAVAKRSKELKPPSSGP